MSEKAEWVKRLEAEPCTCVRCTSCGGYGTAYYDISGRYIGNHHSDDFSDSEPCEYCSGGIAEECDRCVMLRDYEIELP